MAKKRLQFTEEELRGVLESEHQRGYKLGYESGRLGLQRHDELVRRLNTQATAAKAIIALASIMEEVR